jgi:proteasome assembly chaperone (PAC2) family protein
MQPVLVVTVVADALRDRAIEIARKHGAQGISFVAGRGIGFPEHHTFLGLTYMGHEEVLFFALDEKRARKVEEELNRELQLEQRFKGLAFTLPVMDAMGIDVDRMALDLDERDTGPGKP